jgi:hypothetical protein
MSLAKKGRQNIRDTGLREIPDDEISRRARDKDLPSQERQRYIREEKARQLRNKEKRNNFEVSVDPSIAGIAAGGGTIYIAYRIIRILPSLAPPLWPTLPANLTLP